MSQKNPEISHLPSSKSTNVPEGAVVISARSNEATLSKKKEDASQTLYITRV